MLSCQRTFVFYKLFRSDPSLRGLWIKLSHLNRRLSIFTVSTLGLHKFSNGLSNLKLLLLIWLSHLLYQQDAFCQCECRDIDIQAENVQFIKKYILGVEQAEDLKQQHIDKTTKTKDFFSERKCQIVNHAHIKGRI